MGLQEQIGKKLQLIDLNIERDTNHKLCRYDLSCDFGVICYPILVILQNRLFYVFPMWHFYLILVFFQLFFAVLVVHGHFTFLLYLILVI